MSEELALEHARWTLARPWHFDHVQPPLPGMPSGSGLGFTEMPLMMAEEAPERSAVRAFGARHAVPRPTGRLRPVDTVYRGMAHAEWEQAQQRGFIRSDERGVLIPGWEGTNAGVNRSTAEAYLRDNLHRGSGVIAHIAVHPDDGWFASDADGYARTRHPVPLSRVISAEQFHDQAFADHLNEQDRRWG